MLIVRNDLIDDIGRELGVKGFKRNLDDVCLADHRYLQTLVEERDSLLPNPGVIHAAMREGTLDSQKICIVGKIQIACDRLQQRVTPND